MYIMMANVTRQAVAMREEAAQKYNECMENVIRLRERTDNVRWRRQEEKEERRSAEAQALAPALTPKPVVVVSPTIVPPLKFTLTTVEEVQPVSPSHLPPIDAAAPAAGRSEVIMDIDSSVEEEEFL